MVEINLKKIFFFVNFLFNMAIFGNFLEFRCSVCQNFRSNTQGALMGYEHWLGPFSVGSGVGYDHTYLGWKGSTAREKRIEPMEPCTEVLHTNT